MLLMLIFRINGIKSLLQLIQKSVHLIRRRLSVIIQTDDIIAVRIPQSCHQRGMLPEILCKADPFDIFIFCAQLPDRSKRVVRRTVVDKKHIIRILRKTVHLFPDLRYDSWQRMLRSIAGDHKAYFLHVPVPFFLPFFHPARFFHARALFFQRFCPSAFVSSVLTAAIRTISRYFPSMQTSSRNSPSCTNPAFS